MNKKLYSYSNVYMFMYIAICIISPKIKQNNKYLYLPEVESTFGQGELRELFGSKHLTKVILLI